MPCVAKQLYSWIVFGWVLLISWESILSTMMHRFKEESRASVKARRVLSRNYIIVIVLYTLIALWMRILVMSVCIYLMALLTTMAAEYSIAKIIRVVLVHISNPSSLFHSLTAIHVPFHAATVLALFLAAIAAACGYVSDADLQPTQNAASTLQSKFARIFFAVPVIMMSIYMMYAVYNCVLIVLNKS